MTLLQHLYHVGARVAEVGDQAHAAVAIGAGQLQRLAHIVRRDVRGSGSGRGLTAEGMPLALIEGMAAGCAVIGSAVPGVREVLRDGEDGLLVPESDPVAMADALERLLRDEAFAARLGAAARRTAIERHGRALMNQRYEDLCDALAGR